MRFGKMTLATLFIVAASAAQAGPAFTIDNTTGVGLGNPPFTLGFEFTANANVAVTALGLFDDSQDGLAESHAIGLFNSSGTLLASTTIASGTTDPLTNQFRYDNNFAPVILTAGQTYTVGAVYTSGADALIFPGGASNFATDPRITFDQSGFAGGSTLSAPVFSASTDPSYFGPNLMLSSVPEASTMLGFGGLLGAGGLGMLRSRRVRKAN